MTTQSTKPVRTCQIERFVWQLQDQVTIQSAQQIGDYVRTQVYTPWEAFVQEEMWVLLFNTRLRLTHQVMLYRGTMDAVTLRVGELFREAIRFHAASIILAHNHPSGDPQPSEMDLNTTRRVKEASDLIQIKLTDHLIVGESKWVSLREAGRL